MEFKPLIPRQKTPPLSLPLINGGVFTLGASHPETFDLLVFYRGLHCQLCANYLIDLERLSNEFAERGVRITAISGDIEERAKEMVAKVQTERVQYAYALDIYTAQSWGLYISTSRGKTAIGIEEPDHFSEPAVYLIRTDGTLYYGAVQTMPFVRPQFQELLAAIDFAIQKDYPARGEYTGKV